MRLIDADALRMLWLDEDPNLEFEINTVLDSIDEQPTIEARPVRHGQWELINTPSMFMRMLECSVCKGRVGTTVKTNYCPHCGAKMDGGVSDD